MAVLTLQSKGSTGGDVHLDSLSPNNNYGISEFMRAGNTPTSNAKALIRFDLSALPAGALVSSAILTFHTTGQQSSTTRAISAHRGLTQWYEGSSNDAIPSGNGSTWSKRNYPFNVNWGGSVAGGQSGVDYAAAATGSVNVNAIDTFYSITVTADVQAWANGTANNGWWLMVDTGETDSRKDFSSFDASTANQRPKLVITYTSNVNVAPAARFARGSTQAPTIIKGSALRAPTARFAVGATAGPVVKAGFTLSALAAADSVSSTVGPDAVVKGSVERIPAVDTAVGATVNPLVLKTSAVLTPNAAEAVGATGGLASLVDLALRPAAATAIGVTVGRVLAVRVWAEICDPRPLLYITDGTLRDNGQLDALNLIARTNGFTLNNWNPNIAQYKGGGTFSDSALANGRRLIRRSFANAIEVLDLKLHAHNQNNAIEFIRELFEWQELAADYWTSDWAQRPVYLVAKAAKENQIRYAMIYMMSCPELTNPYTQPFFGRDGKAASEGITLRIERADWKDSPPGEGRCVALSSQRAWTIQGWSVSNTTGGGDDTITGNVTAFVQANNGDLLAGTSGQAKIYRSIDDGKTWSYLTKFSGAIASVDNINAFTKDSAGNLYAAVTGNAVAQGVWKSVNNGVSWTKVKSHPAGTGYLDITAAQGSKLTAVGKPTASNASPITYSSNAGVTWTDVSTPYYNQEHMSVAAYQEPYLFSQYPGEQYGDVFTFIGTNSYYTAQYGVKSTTSGPQLAGFGTLGGGAGNGGLDMVSFLVKDSAGRYLRRALWAVKSAADVTDTEIWQWPSGTYQSGSTQFSKFATIDNKLFNVLYVDTTPDANAAARTIWAGANGEIWVSYNSGLTWALATDAPVNQIRAIIRSKAGTLIAGGDNAEIFRYTGTGSQGGGVGNTQDTATFSGGAVVNTYPLGREETCDDEVYAANKSVFSNITHVLHYNGSTYSELQFATQPPYNLLGTNPTVNKAAYFGSKTSDPNVPGSVFSGVVFDITQIAQDLTLVWEYWNGSAWTALTVQDSSNGFRVLDNGSVHWVVPTNWATAAVNGITGYWVRVRISAVGPNPVYPIHGSALHSRYIYTPNLPYVEIGKHEIDGDMPADGQIRWRNRGDDPAAVIDMEVDRLLCGLRSVERGNFFNAYINISDVQIPYGFTITKHVDGVWGASVRAPTNRALTASHSSSGNLNIWNDMVTFSIANTVARDYYGSYHVFLRVYKSGTGTNNWQVRLRTSFGSGGSTKDSKVAFPTQGADWEAIDLGEVSIPTTQVARLGSNLGDLLKLTVQTYCTATGTALVFYDLILIPVDEWAVDSISPLPNIADTAKVKGGAVLDIDSITNPKASLTATNKTSGDLIVARYQAINNGPVMLQRGAQQRLWFLMMSYENYWRSFPEITGSVQAFKQQRYFAYRGAT